MNLVLYYAPNTCALAPYITLTEANAPFEVRPLNFRKGENKSPDYLRINPKHKVPLLMIDGEPLTESTAIQLWIARNFPQAKLMPSDPWQELKAISMMSWCSSGIHPFLQRINSPPKVCDTPGSEASIVGCREDLVRKLQDRRRPPRRPRFSSTLHGADAHSSGACVAACSSGSN
jgi:glutathione S-transferase